ncbi:MAG TPA: hypothetical protein VEW64_03630 [Methyloceanibacter sp.]|jgi:hypothetical protein|nr:hypothetical protein [Methyloceanibacter sp.]
MPQVLLLIAAGAGLVLAGRRWYVRERDRIAAELRAANEAMMRRDEKPIQRLELDPSTGIYRPKQVARGAHSTRH